MTTRNCKRYFFFTYFLRSIHSYSYLTSFSHLIFTTLCDIHIVVFFFAMTAKQATQMRNQEVASIITCFFIFSPCHLTIVVL